ncbi:MAG: MFS transporter [Butyrivibrio sp.]|jgi:Na+/melibiose symporter-like transporter|nr:MFS transporter [Butyrivibrio sp.]
MGKTKESPAASGKIGMGKMMAWQSHSISTSIQVVLLGYLQIYCTNALGMKAVLVGSILMGCKIVDGFTDLVAGYIVDRTNTKWGRGRPYEWCIVGLWLTTWLVFSVPAQATMLVKCIWIVVCYTAAQSIFCTFLNASGTAYMVRAFDNEKIYVTLSSVGGILVTLCVIVFNTITPVFEAKVLYDASGWSLMVACIAIPLTIIGMMRFFFIKEDKVIDTKETKEVHLKDVLILLKNNKSVYIVALLMFVSAVVSNMGVGSYYFIYIVKNLSISGVMSLLAIIIMPTMLLYPVMIRKIPVTRIMQLFMLLQLIAGPILWFAKANLFMLAIGGLLSGMATLPISYLSGLLIVDCANYNEWHHRPRMEGTLGSITGFANKIGSAFGAFIVGVLLSSSGFDGSKTVQVESANLMIRLLYSIVPMVFMLAMCAILCLWKIDKVKPQMLKELEERRAQSMEAAQDSETQVTGKKEA